MSSKDGIIKIAIDAMGGDHAPQVPLEGLKLFVQEFAEDVESGIRFNVFGTQVIKRKIPGSIKEYVTFHQVEQVVSSSEKPANAVRNFQDSSMALAIYSVKNQESQASVSGGNTGALMALSKTILKTIPGIRRPALISRFPCESETVIGLDLGANVSCDPQMLLEFALMGKAFLSSIADGQKPKIGLINIGSEHSKGPESLSETYKLFSEFFSGNEFVGFVEPDRIVRGDANIAIADGFTGNIIVKSMEGVSGIFSTAVRKCHSEASTIEKILAFPYLLRFKKNTQILRKDIYNAGMLIGLNGISIKSHGSASAAGFKHAITVSHSLAKNNIIEKISSNIEDKNQALKS